ncbi:MAG: DUF4290 domain-containing protein [Bacteroidales bacterium]|nr:DUF4290 domain-containing protein [Bacteroidales bacterium]
MLEYNTQLKKLLLPEYGRNIQQMVEYCITIEDREERTRCAYSIVATMGNLFPHLRDVDDFKHKLWDHLAIMSDFKLDIDYPYEVLRPDNLYTAPKQLEYDQSSIMYRHYGKIIEKMLGKCQEYPKGSDEQKQMLSIMANVMKKTLYNTTKEVVEDDKILKDIKEYIPDATDKLTVDDLNLRSIKELQTRKTNTNNNVRNTRFNKK